MDLQTGINLFNRVTNIPFSLNGYGITFEQILIYLGFGSLIAFFIAKIFK